MDKIQRICLGCNEEYEATFVSVAGIEFTLGEGYCQKCNHARLAELEELEKNQLLMEISAKRRHWRNTCGISPLFRDKEFGTFDLTYVDPSVKTAFNVAKDFADNFPLLSPQKYRSLVLFSEKAWGVGKSHLVNSIAHRILNRWSGETSVGPVHVTTESDMFYRLQASYNIPPDQIYYRETEADIIRHLTTVPLLILDDIGKEERADPRFVQRTLFAVVDGRYRRMLPLVLTANLNPERLAVHLGGQAGSQATFDRLWEMCRGEFVLMSGPSYRRRHA